MSAYSELILFTVNLAVNLFLFGALIAVSVAVSFRLIKNAPPRLRYVITVTAFLIAAFIPLAVTLNGSIGLEKLIEAKQSGSANPFAHNLVNQTSVITPEIISPASKSENTSSGFLNNFTALVAASFIGIVLFSLWITGSICFLFRDIFAHRRLRKARQSWRLATNSERKELAFPERTALYFGEESPATVGLFYPLIVLPERFPDNISLASKRYIIQHELAHARWRDPLVNFLLRLIRALFWVSPALWMLERIAGAERESAADYAAITKCSVSKSDFEATALNYATTLVSVANHFNSYAPRGSFRPNAINLSNGSILESRIRRLLTHSSNPTRLRISLASIIFASSLIGLFFMPIAFQPNSMKNQAEAAVIYNQEPAEALTVNKNLNDLPIANRQNKLSQIAAGNENKEKNSKAAISNQDKNEQEQFLIQVKKVNQTPQNSAQIPKQFESLNNDADHENLMKKLGEEDAKASGIQQKIDELSGKLDNLRKNLESNIVEVRQKAASDLDSMMQAPPVKIKLTN